MKYPASKMTHERGLSIVELLVSLAIGSLLIVGAVFVYSQSRTTATVSDTVARLQENARFIMSIVEPDVQLAGAFGYDNYPSDLSYAPDISINKMRQNDVKFSAAPDAAHECGTNFALDLVATVQGLDNTYTLACAAFGAGAALNTDVLIVRRASATPQPSNPAILQLYTNRITPWAQKLFIGAVPGTLTPDMVDVRDLIVDAYYVSQDSDNRPGFPSLRRKRLGLDAIGYRMIDEEIMAGVEDMQVQFGVDMGEDLDGDGAPDDDDGNGVADSTNGSVTRYVNANVAGRANMDFGQVASVRMWVRLRAEQGETGFINQTRYQYASTDFTPAANDNVRRLVVARTFYLRNSRLLRD
jgi:type IV pilus assembly protein PilW